MKKKKWLDLCFTSSWVGNHQGTWSLADCFQSSSLGERNNFKESWSLTNYKIVFTEWTALPFTEWSNFPFSFKMFSYLAWPYEKQSIISSVFHGCHSSDFYPYFLPHTHNLVKMNFQFFRDSFYKHWIWRKGNLMNIKRAVSKELNLLEKSKVQYTHTHTHYIHIHTHTHSVFFCFPELPLVSLNSSWRINFLTLKNQMLSYRISSCSSWKIFLALI